MSYRSLPLVKVDVNCPSCNDTRVQVWFKKISGEWVMQYEPCADCPEFMPEINERGLDYDEPIHAHNEP